MSAFREKIARLVAQEGSQTAFAAKLGVSQPTVWHLMNTAERVSAEMALRLEAVEDWGFTRHELRPDLWPQPDQGVAA